MTRPAKGTGTGIKPPRPDLAQKQPFLEEKLAKANKLLAETKLPDELVERLNHNRPA
jgi:hypothetical protein